VTDAAAAGANRLRRLERGSFILLGVCATALVAITAWDAYTGPLSFGQSLLDWPPHLVVAFIVGGACSLIPYTAVGMHRTWRVVALVAQIGSVMWLAVVIGFVAFITLALSHFD